MKEDSPSARVALAIFALGRNSTSFSARYASKMSRAGSGKGHGTGAVTTTRTASRTPAFRKVSSATNAASKGATGHLYGVAAMVTASVRFFSAFTAPEVSSREASSFKTSFASSMILSMSLLCLSRWSCAYMSTHSRRPGIPDASPTIPGDNTSASYGIGVSGASLRVTVFFSMSTLSTVVLSLRSTFGSCGAASFSGHVVCDASTRPHHAYAHVPPMVNQSLASITTTLFVASFATALASVCAHPRPPKPAPTMTTRDMLFAICLRGREANARERLSRRERAMEWCPREPPLGFYKRRTLGMARRRPEVRSTAGFFVSIVSRFE